MIRATILCCVVYFVAISPLLTSAMTDEQRKQIHEQFEKIGMECLKENPISEDDIKTLKSKQLPTGEKVPCFLACMYRSIGIMDEHGMIQKENALELAKTVFKDEDELKSISDYLHSCSGINSEPVTDGDKGCERSMKAFKCMLDNAAQFGFDL